MRISESIISNLLSEVDSLTCRLRNIKECFNTTLNTRLKKRLLKEKEIICERINEVNNLAEYFNRKSRDKFSYSALLVEKCKRTRNDNKSERNLFFP